MEPDNPKKEIFKINVMQVSMTMGTKLGLYIVLVYAMLMLSLRYQSLTMVALPLLAGIPVVAYFVVRRVRSKTRFPFFPFPLAWMLSLLMFIFATVLSGMVAYMYLRFIDHGALAQSIMAHVDLMNESGMKEISAITDPNLVQQYTETLDVLTQAARWFTGLSSSGIAKQLMQSTITWGNIISIIISLLLMKRIKL